ncbi:putative ankyrin repeat protein RF_0381 [Phymastichus coffea]|uniref:putative ankyrin repeat protein RF_0381 n=1 Tax=Phymastichus coffea TaxID=108790 RepID=UPI00273B11AF|nr:putative ankyrin repeat protein RF_0381 [Phymastichus coffea]XP_058802920.1 putative ankyrin repeat protein RF_0381 [Phymastichus coffea]
MEGEENEIVQIADIDSSSEENYDGDSDDEDLREYYLTAVRHHSKLSKKELKRLLKSSQPEDQKALNKIITNILLRDNSEALYYLLKKGHKLDTFDERGETIYHSAYYQNSLSILSLLLEWQCDELTDDDYVDGNGLSCLHIASFGGTENSVNKYLKFSDNVNAHYRCNFDDYRYRNEINRDGFTPLHFAAINYKTRRILRLLLDNGADVSAMDSSNRTALHIACRSYESPEYVNHDSIDTYSSISVMKVLVEYKSDVNARDNEDNTPLLSIFPDDFGVFETTRGLGFIESIPLLEIKEKLKFLLQQGVDVTARNKNGDNILHLIVKNLDHWRCSPTYSELSFDFDNDHRDMVKQVLEVDQRLDVNVRNNKGDSPIRLAVSSISSQIVKVLLEYGADLSDIRFDYQYVSCFNYPRILPDLDAVQNVITVVKLLANNDWELTLEGNLAVMKFLVHDVDACQCRSLLDVLHLGSLKHINLILNKKIDALTDNSGTDKHQIIVDINQFFLKKMIIGPDKDIDVLYSLIIAYHKLAVTVTVEGVESLQSIIFEKVKMQLTKLQGNFTVHSVLIEHPDNIYFLVRNHNFQSIAKNFPIYENFIKGHVAKGFIRHYIENSAYAYLERLSFAFIPYTCCKRILYYSTNEDILNLCLAAVLSDV